MLYKNKKGRTLSLLTTQDGYVEKQSKEKKRVNPQPPHMYFHTKKVEEEIRFSYTLFRLKHTHTPTVFFFSFFNVGTRTQRALALPFFLYSCYEKKSKDKKKRKRKWNFFSSNPSKLHPYVILVCLKYKFSFLLFWIPPTHTYSFPSDKKSKYLISNKIKS